MLQYEEARRAKASGYVPYFEALLWQRDDAREQGPSLYILHLFATYSNCSLLYTGVASDGNRSYVRGDRGTRRVRSPAE